MQNATTKPLVMLQAMKSYVSFNAYIIALGVKWLERRERGQNSVVIGNTKLSTLSPQFVMLKMK